MRIHTPQESSITREIEILTDEINELAVAVMLRHRVRAPGINHTWYLAVLILV